MRDARRRAALVLMAMFAAGCGTGTPAATNNDADVKAVEALQDRELALVTGPTLDSIGTIYTDDVDFMPPGEPAVEGLDAVKKWAQAMLEGATMSGKYTSSKVTVAGDVAISRYTATLSATPKTGGPAMEETLKGVHVLKRQPGGAWKISLDTWNTDKPETPPPAPATKAPPKKG